MAHHLFARPEEDLPAAAQVTDQDRVYSSSLVLGWSLSLALGWSLSLVLGWSLSLALG